MTFCKFFIPSLISFNSLTRPSFKSFCMSVTGLKSFESSYCVLKSPTRSDKKCYWMFCLALRNSLTIMSLFLRSVIFRNDMFLLRIFLICRTWFRTQFRTWFWTSFWTWFWTWAWTWFWTRFWTWFWTRFWTWFWTWTQAGIVVIFRLNKTLASVSILPVFSRLVLDFILRTSLIRLKVSNSNKICEYSSDEMNSCDNAFDTHNIKCWNS